MIVDPMLSKMRFDRDIAPLGNHALASTGVRQLNHAPVVVALHCPALDDEILLRLDGAEYDWWPADGWWVTDAGGLTPRLGRIPVGLGFQVAPTFYGDQRAWFCFVGWRVYHEHPGHHSTSWSALRGDPHYRVGALVHQLATDLRRPEITVQ